MDCDICLEKYDNSIKRPLIIIKCGHTYCAECLGNLIEKKCPSCNVYIDSTITNFAVLKTTSESEYDKLKAELEKSLKELESFEKNLAEDRKNKIQQNSERVKLVKNKVENQTNVLIKLLNENKKRLFKEIEENSKLLNQNQKISVALNKRDEIAEKLSSNKYNKKQLIEVRDDIIKQNIELSQKTEEQTESFDFFVNEEIKIDEKFIGEIKKVKISASTKIEKNTFPLKDKILNGNFSEFKIELELLSSGELIGHEDLVECLVALPDGLLASGSRDKTIRIWNYKTNESIKILKGHTGAITGLVALADGALASVSRDKTIRVWNIREGRSTKILKHDDVICITLLPDGKLISGGLKECSCKDCQDCKSQFSIRVWDLKTGKTVKMLTSNSWAVFCLAYIPDGSLAIGGNIDDSTIQIKKLDNDQTIRVLTGHTNAIKNLLVLPDKTLASSSHDNTMRIWDLKTGQTIKLLDQNKETIHGLLAFSNDSLAFGSDNYDEDYCNLCIWDTIKERPIEIPMESFINCLALLPNGGMASGNNNIFCSITIWN